MINPLFATIGSFFLLVSALGCGSESVSTQVRTMEVTVLFPADEQKYNEMITGEQDFKRAAELPFVKKKVVVPYSTDVIRASADAAAKEMPTEGGPTIIYLKIEKGTAYVLLNIDRDGWAGVSFSRARCHPVVERTLLQFKAIERVVWDEAPGDQRRHNNTGAANVRPASPVRVAGLWDRFLCAPPLLAAHVADLCRSE